MARFDSEDSRVALLGFAAAYVSYAIKHPGMFHLMYGSGVPTPPSGHADDESTVLGLISSRLARLVPEERLAESRLAGWSMIHGLATLIVQGRIRTPSKDVTATAKRLIEIVLVGLVPRFDLPPKENCSR